MFKGLWSVRWGSANDPLRAALGNLEREVMEEVWSHDESAVRTVQAALARPVAYTTVMTTLDRLFKKGFVTRIRVGRGFQYKAGYTREQVESAVAAGLLTGFLGEADRARPMLSNLVDVVAAQDTALLDELEELVRQKRRDLGLADRNGDGE